MRQQIISCLICMLLVSATSYADTIVLQNGNTIEGLIVGQTETSITIEVPTGSLTLDKADIREAIRSSDSERLAIEENHDRIMIEAQKEALEQSRKEALRQQEPVPELPADNDAALSGQQEPPAPDAEYEIVSFSIREVNRKKYWHRLYWELKMRNYTGRPQIISARIQFFDSRRVLVDEVVLDGILLQDEPELTSYTDYDRAAGINHFSGYLYLDAYIARYVSAALISVDTDDEGFSAQYPGEGEPY
ncbi:MAG: hypothetical protein AB1454_03285 [Candidatus Auribacterota bacterium]